MDYTYRLLDFTVFEDKSEGNDIARFCIKMFAINSDGQTAAILVPDYTPFFYLKIPDYWGKSKQLELYQHLTQRIGPSLAKAILSFKLVERRKLYGYDAGTKHHFIEIKFANMIAYNKVKNLWFKNETNEDGEQERRLIPGGYKFGSAFLEIYETNIPPLLRFFHIQEISPSGWISLPFKQTTLVFCKNTSCDFEYVIECKHIVPLNSKEDIVPYKIMSFDIEASSSHGDFPVPQKSYKKLATDIVDYFHKNGTSHITSLTETLRRIMYKAFQLDTNAMITEDLESIHVVYSKQPIVSADDLEQRFKAFAESIAFTNEISEVHLIESLFEKANVAMSKIESKDKNKEGDGEGDGDKDGDNDDEEDDDEEDDDDCNDTFDDVSKPVGKSWLQAASASASASASSANTKVRIIDMLFNPSVPRETKINGLITALGKHFPPLEGDKITFIGSTFLKYGTTEPYLNHCIALNSCDALPVPNSELESYDNEADVLLAWTALVQRENPDIIIGYNIFSFDYEFMFRRSQELHCTEDFLKLSRNLGEVCGTYDSNFPADPSKLDIDRSSTKLASGAYDLAIIKMPGRLQIDMLNWFRRTENLTTYKLDYVAGYYIGDDVKSIEHSGKDASTSTEEVVMVTRIKTGNLFGLEEESYVHFEEINHSRDYYKGGKKFKVIALNKTEGWFEIEGHESPYAKTVKWGLAKDDLTPKDIFRMTNEGPTERSIVAKYCVQDCNLVHHLFNKVDVITDLVEMSKLCSVPMSFLIFRGQGVKLTSYVAKKCREKGVLMPVINKGSKNDGYEGAIVLKPKCGLYLEDPTNVGDFASLYPSSMLSENLCPSSKVWTKIFDLDGILIQDTGEKNADGSFKYDNLPGIEYVNVTFDTFRYVKKHAKAKAEKVKSGYKICRFAQPTVVDGKEEKAIMPSILQELLKARKDTRKLIPNTPDEFMKNILDKRQLAYKCTANSLYGILGAKTSDFYEPDIAASTTATGRMLLTFAKRVVEECYANTTLDTKYGPVTTHAEYVYGDTDSVFFKLNLTDAATNEPIKGEKALELSIDIAQQACHEVSKVLKKPHDFEYEKTFMPFCLLSKKRYVSIKYEFNHLKGKRDQMGIVLKRRDNAPIVKDVYGGVIDILMKEKNIQKAIDFVHKSLQDLLDGKVPIEKLIITKSLRSFYKNPQGVAHKVLADRIAQREPGNKPTSGDRVPFVYIVTKGASDSKKKKVLQGDKIETPSFIKENNLQIDYSFYITNQIMKPLLQLFGLVLKDIWLSKKPRLMGKVAALDKAIEKIIQETPDEKKCDKKISKLKDKEVEELIFSKYLRDASNRKQGNQNVTAFFPQAKRTKLN